MSLNKRPFHRTLRLKLAALAMGLIAGLAHYLGYWARVLAAYQSVVGFQPRPDDIFIATYPKSGTTWMQMIVYQITSSGSMDFSHISKISPTLEEAVASGIDLEGLESPRILKTHLAYPRTPAGAGKYIYVIRDGLDVAVSYYPHYKMFRGYTGSFNEFFDMFVKGKAAYGSWFEHVRDWTANPRGLDVLYVRFAELVDDLEGSIHRIAEFCGVEILEEDMPRILERCSFEFMKKHETKFDLAYRLINMREESDRFLRKGKVGDWKNHVQDDQMARYREAYDKYLGQVEGIGRPS